MGDSALNLNIRIDYDEVQTIGREFDQQAAMTETLYRALAGQTDNLRTWGWAGDGAHAFYAEMDELILPACAALVLALRETQTVLNDVSRIFEDAESEAASPFLLTASEAGALGSGVSLVFNGIDILTYLQSYDDIAKHGIKISGLDVTLTLAAGFIGGAIDLISGEETDVFNAFGKNLYSAGIDLGVTVVSGGVPVVAIASLLSEGTSFAGQLGIGLNREVNDYLTLDPRVQLELERGLDYDERVFQGIGELTDTWESLKDATWDVIGRPAANDYQASINHFNNALRTGDLSEFARSITHMTEASASFTSMGAAMNILTDADARQHFSDHVQETLNHGWNFTASASELSGAVTRMPVRLGVTAFNGIVNEMPLDAGTKRGLNAVSLEAAEMVNNMSNPTMPFLRVDASIWDAPQRVFDSLGL